MTRVLIAGCGDVGCALGERLAAAGDEIWGLRRSVDALPSSIRPLAADLRDPATLTELPGGLDHVVFAAAATERKDDAYRAVYVDGLRHLIQALESQGQRPRRLLFTSSTGVYGQSDGSRVDESSPTDPPGFTGRRMLEAEALLTTAPWPTVAVRFGGIYGPGRDRLIRRAAAGEPIQRRPPFYTNRIHRDDCAGVLAHLLELDDPAPVYVAVDEAPVPLAEVVDWICGRQGWPRPPASDGPGRGRGKRCDGGLLRKGGYSFRYPSYREGYGELLLSGRRRPGRG